MSTEYEEKQWKYVGYRGFCKFLASDDDFLILRRFGNLSIRVLLALQDELVDLEGQLETIENTLARFDAPDAHNGSFRQETVECRHELIREIDRKLRSYNELLLQHSALLSRPKPPARNVSSISNWLHNHKNAISAPETSFLSERRDLMPLVTKSISPFRSLLEKSKQFRLLGLWKKRTLDGDTVHYYSEQRIDLFVSVVLTVVGLFMLVAPLWVLAFVEDKIKRLWVITLFVVIFLPLVVFTSRVTNTQASLAATAAYAAVLVVFLQVSP